MAEADPIEVDRAFFSHLIDADTAALAELLTEDFLLIAVANGQEVPKSAFLGMLASGQLRFISIESAEVRVRRFGKTAIVTGRTVMCGSLAGQESTVRSRYTHVYVELDGRWRMASAQGTPILEG